VQRCQPGNIADAPASAYSAVIGIRSTDNAAMVYRALRPQARCCSIRSPRLCPGAADSMSVESTPPSGRCAAWAMAQLRQYADLSAEGRGRAESWRRVCRTGFYARCGYWIFRCWVEMSMYESARDRERKMEKCV